MSEIQKVARAIWQGNPAEIRHRYDIYADKMVPCSWEEYGWKEIYERHATHAIAALDEIRAQEGYCRAVEATRLQRMDHRMSEMIERVAKAMFEDAENKPVMRSVKAHYLEMARAAIAAMREPTTAMLNAVRVEPAYYAEIRDAYQKVWGDMIDEALK